MQWLVDLIIEAIGIPPVFIDRGDPAAIDYTTGDFTKDNTWRDLDLSGIIPENAQGVVLNLRMNITVVNKFFALREKGNVNANNIARAYSQAANITYAADLICPLPTSRILEYIIAPGVWTILDLTVKGWWL